MTMDEMVNEIQVDLGSDVNSLGITSNTIELKIKEAMRKIGSYAPRIKVATYDTQGGYVQLSENTVMVSQVLSDNVTSKSVDRNSPLYDETDLFNASRYIFNSYNSSLADPYIYLMNISELRTLQNLVALTDWHYDKGTHQLYLSNYTGTRITIKSLETYNSIEEIQDQDMLQTVKEYSLALCKIVEGGIRRKLQAAPGSIQMDGDALVSEGTSEKARLDEQIPKQFSYLRFGMRV